MIRFFAILSSVAVASAQEQGGDVFDTSVAFTPSVGGKALNIANIDPSNILVGLPDSVQKLNHKNITMIEDPMDLVWSWSPPKGTKLEAGPVLHPLKNEFFVGDDQLRVHCVNALTGKIKWTFDMDPQVTPTKNSDGKMSIAPHPNGRIVLVAVGDQLMALSVDLGETLFSRRFGPATISTEILFVTPSVGPAPELSSKCVFGDTSGIIHAMDTSTGRKAWSWKFSTSGAVTHLVPHVSTSGGVGSIVAANLIGDLASLRGDSGTLLWRSQISGSDDATIMLKGESALLSGDEALLLSNDNSRGALLHSVNLATGVSSVWTLLSGPGASVGGLKIDMSIPHVFITTNSEVHVFSLTASSTAISEFPVRGFPSTPMTFETGVSEPCTYYIGTTGGSVTLVTYESLTDGGTCSFPGGGEREPDRKGDETGVAGEEDVEQDREGVVPEGEVVVPEEMPEDGESRLLDNVEVEATMIGVNMEGLPDSMDNGLADDGGEFEIADPNSIEGEKEAEWNEQYTEEVDFDGDEKDVEPCEPIDMSQPL